MPKVPASQSNVVPMQKPPEEVYFAMAAAQMDMQGRLFQPEHELPYLKPDERGSPAAATKSLRQEGNTKEQASEKVQKQMQKEGIDLEGVPGS